jgi:hypothetical protein
MISARDLVISPADSSLGRRYCCLLGYRRRKSVRRVRPRARACKQPVEVRGVDDSAPQRCLMAPAERRMLDGCHVIPMKTIPMCTALAAAM